VTKTGMTEVATSVVVELTATISNSSSRRRKIVTFIWRRDL